jgi:hypothetical protein
VWDHPERPAMRGLLRPGRPHSEKFHAAREPLQLLQYLFSVAQPSRLRVEGRPRPVHTFGDETSAELAGEDACATPACAQR